jgi:integrase
MGGLQLWIFPTGSKLWRLAYRFGGKQKLLALGRYPEVTLQEARAEREKAKALLGDGHDPSQANREARRERETLGDTFEIVAQEYVAKARREGRAAVTLEKNEWLLRLANPVLGPMAVSAIRPVDVLGVLRRVEGKGLYETADRLRALIGAVCRYAIATARAQTDPTLPLRGALTSHAVKPMAAIADAKAFGALLRAIDGFAGQRTTRDGLKLMALLFPRPGELRGAEWAEFDLDAGVWTIPAPRTKMRREHRVPLAPQAIAILRDLTSVTGSGAFVLPCVRTVRRPMSENTLNAALRRLGYAQDEMTSHGFRATASTLLNESGRWSADAIERELGHVEGNEVRRAYARGEHWDERVKMMAWWADHLDQLKIVGQILPLDRKSA